MQVRKPATGPAVSDRPAQLIGNAIAYAGCFLMTCLLAATALYGLRAIPRFLLN